MPGILSNISKNLPQYFQFVLIFQGVELKNAHIGTEEAVSFWSITIARIAEFQLISPKNSKL